MPPAFHNFLQRVRQRAKSMSEGRRSTSYDITHDTAGMKVSWLTMENESGEYKICWDDAIAVRAFKRDCFAVDLICLEIELRDKNALEINEEMKGWDSLVEKLPDYLPGCKRFAEWWEAVAIPAFEPNVTLLYQRCDASKTT